MTSCATSDFLGSCARCAPTPSMRPPPTGRSSPCAVAPRCNAPTAAARPSAAAAAAGGRQVWRRLHRHHFARRQLRQGDNTQRQGQLGAHVRHGARGGAEERRGHPLQDDFRLGGCALLPRPPRSLRTCRHRRLTDAAPATSAAASPPHRISTRAGPVLRTRLESKRWGACQSLRYLAGEIMVVKTTAQSAVGGEAVMFWFFERMQASKASDKGGSRAPGRSAGPAASRARWRSAERPGGCAVPRARA